MNGPKHVSPSEPDLAPPFAEDARAGLVLTALIESYIATGDPVSSQAIARQQNREGMSAATVRNVMAELADAGYLEQPHTSAGRVPTARAFRYYVEQLLRNGPLPHQGLPQPAQDRIEESLAGVTSATDFFARTSHVLAGLSGGLGIALTAPGERELLEHVHFARLGQQRVLAVVVTAAGAVRDRLLKLDHDWTMEELERASNYLNRSFRGWALDRIRHEITLRMQAEKSEYGRILASLVELWGRWTGPGGADPTSHPGENSATERTAQDENVFIEGFANLMVSEVDREHLRRMLRALEEKQRIVELLNAYVDSRNSSVRVVVGLDGTLPEMRDLVLVAAPARRGDEHLGTVGVIGPTRMQYASTIGSVTYIADLFGRWASEP